MRLLFILVTCGLIAGCGGGSYEGYTDTELQEATDAAAQGAVDALKKTATKRPSPPPEPKESVAAVDPPAPDPAPGPVRPAPVAPAADSSPPAYKPRSNSVVGSVLGARDRNTALNNGKGLALGMLQGDKLPTQAMLSKEGTPLLSWRVKVLQSLDKNLYNAFNHEVAWDHPDNKKLIARMPSMFKAGYAFEDDGYTVVKVVTGDETMFPTGAKRGMSLRQARDGTSKTVMFVYADPNNAVPWTKPEDITFNPESGGEGIIGPDGTFIAAFCDGSVKRLSGLRGDTIKAILTRSGGEIVSLDQ